MKSKHLLISARAYPERGSKLYYRVVIFDCLYSMRIFCKEAATLIGAKHNTKNYAACVSFGREQRSKRSPNQIGLMIFCREYFGAGTCTHEATHAAMEYLRLYGWKRTRLIHLTRHDERMAMCADNCARVANNAFHKIPQRTLNRKACLRP